MTGWRLFSERRHATQTGWSAVEVRPDGTERVVDFSALGRGYTGALHVMGGFPSMDTAEREQVCRSWVAALRAQEPTTAPAAVALRVYRTQSTLEDNRPVEQGRELVHECG